MTVDFVNQSSLNMSTSQLDTQQSDKTDFAERLGQMNNRWQRISSDVAGRMKNLELIQVKWDEFEMGIKALQDWYHDNELKVKRHNRLGHEVTIQQSLKECKVYHIHNLYNICIFPMLRFKNLNIRGSQHLFFYTILNIHLVNLHTEDSFPKIKLFLPGLPDSSFLWWGFNTFK